MFFQEGWWDKSGAQREDDDESHLVCALLMVTCEAGIHPTYFYNRIPNLGTSIKFLESGGMDLGLKIPTYPQGI